jgi:hypothetical protein
MRPLALILSTTISLLSLPGCGTGPKLVPVSGVITLDGKPYGEAVISFQPVGTDKNPNPGRGSSAETDKDGKFVLKTDEAKVGAVPGKHKVRIMTRGADLPAAYDPTKGSPDGVVTAPAPRGKPDPIPMEWRDKDFEVPPEGTDKANFEIVSKR